MAPAGPFEASVRACARVAIPRDRVFSFLLRPPLDPLLFISISTNFSSRTRRGYNKEEEQEEEEEDKGVSAARFGYWFRRILSSREQIFARSSLDIYVEEKGGEPTLSSDLSSINIPWTVFQKRHARGFPKYLRSLCANTPVYVRKRAERNEIVLASFPAFGEGMEMASLSGRTSLTKKQKLQKYTCTVTYANGTIETHG